MKVAIIFIGTSKYLDFLPLYWDKVEHNFLPGVEKTIFAFTDGEVPDAPSNVRVVKETHKPWPYITLLRFETINMVRDELSEYDYLVFMDADTLVVDTITEEEFVTDKPLFGVHHPCHYMNMSPHNELPGAYEPNENSEAYFNVFEAKPEVYYQGCFWGGKIPEVFDMMDTIIARTRKDLDNDIVALWHDETHINKYFNENKDLVHTFGPEYAYPELFRDSCNFPERIVHLAKDNSRYQT